MKNAFVLTTVQISFCKTHICLFIKRIYSFVCRYYDYIIDMLFCSFESCFSFLLFTCHCYVILIFFCSSFIVGLCLCYFFTEWLVRLRCRLVNWLRGGLRCLFRTYNIKINHFVFYFVYRNKPVKCIYLPLMERVVW